VRLFDSEQIVGMLEATGVTVNNSFGDYDASPLTPGAPRTILMGRLA
jgi:hypothetical protein